MSRLHDAEHQRNAVVVRRWADSTPTARCWVCRRTKAEHGRRWTAGHYPDGMRHALPWLSNDEPPAGRWLRAECEACNYSRGAQRGNELRRQPGTTRVW